MPKYNKAHARLLLSGILLLGGVICILVPAWELEARSLSFVIPGIALVMLGTSFFVEAARRARDKGQSNG